MNWTPLPSTHQLVESGRRLRKEVPRASLATLSSGVRDPLGILTEQNATRLPELIGLRAERMSASPFAFYRGTAALMAADLADGPHTGLQVASCGDAHVANFGFYASPQRTLVFDLNDFDEAAWAPWEWDLKRLVTSVIIGGRHSGRSGEVMTAAAIRTTLAYRRALAEAMELSPTQRFFTHFDAAAGIDRVPQESRRVLQDAIKSAQRRTGERAVRRLTVRDADGRARFVERPPTMTRLSTAIESQVHDYVDRYYASASPDIRFVLAHYTVADVARRVVGVGSVGTRCTLVLLQDGDDNAFILQSKEANASVLEQYGRIEQPPVLADLIAARGQGARVVALQQILQAVSDPFLGHLRGTQADLYVRQFHDMKGGIDVEGLDDGPFTLYAMACGVTLARAHSQSPRAASVVGYLGSGRSAAEAIAEWGMAYADLSAQDFRSFVGATA
ncbi:MAG TPA: DUF2252 domain-containing protein [Micropruina sp.]|nr:DUF2252 domain-containing protein [Micropruina sp.]HMR20501.1 DUF2252 domain-containing protein [Micropruina sp.]